MKKILTTLFLIGLIVFSCPMQAQHIPRFAHVDKEELIFRLLEKEGAHTQLRKMEDSMSSVLEEMVDKYKKSKRNIRGISAEKDAEVFDVALKMMENIEERRMDFENLSNIEFLQLRKKMLKEAKERVENAIKSFSAEQGINYVLDTKSLTYISDDMQDISVQVANLLGVSFDSNLSDEVRLYFDEGFDRIQDYIIYRNRDIMILY